MKNAKSLANEAFDVSVFLKDSILSNNPFRNHAGNLVLFCGNFAFPILECLNFHTENRSTYTQHVLRKNIIVVCFQTTFLLCHKISSNRKKAKH